MHSSGFWAERTLISSSQVLHRAGTNGKKKMEDAIINVGLHHALNGSETWNKAREPAFWKHPCVTSKRDQDDKKQTYFHIYVKGFVLKCPVNLTGPTKPVLRRWKGPGVKPDKQARQDLLNAVRTAF